MQAAWGRWKWPAALALCVLAAGALSVRERLDVNWDLKNYHFYNAFAFLNGRMGWDIAPAQVQTYYNPLLDLPFYYLVEAIPSPRIIAAVMAASTGVAAFFLLRIVSILFPRGAVPDRVLWIALAFAVGVTGAAGLSVIGSTMNEWPPAMLVMAALAVLVASIADRGAPTIAAIALAGILGGIAVGLKLTYGIFGLALFAALGALGTMRERLWRLAAMGGFLALGFLLAYGFWGAILYREYGNPFFPYFNAIFKSPYWEPINFFDRNFGPRDWLQAIAFPIYYARDHKLVAEVSFRDWRLAVLMVVAAGCVVKYALVRNKIPDVWKFLSLFTLVAYLAWLKLFGIFRYLVPLEMLSGALIVGGLLYLIPGKNARRAAIVIVAVLLIGTTRKASWGRLDFHGAYFDVEAPAIPANSLVIVGPYEPMAYAIAFFRPDARFVSPANNFLHFTQSNLLAKRVAEIVAAHTGPIYALDLQDRADVDLSLKHFGLARDVTKCLRVRSNLDMSMMRVCPVQRVKR